jgi:hypothetical protein
MYNSVLDIKMCKRVNTSKKEKEKKGMKKKKKNKSRQRYVRHGKLTKEPGVLQWMQV